MIRNKNKKGEQVSLALYISRYHLSEPLRIDSYVEGLQSYIQRRAHKFLFVYKTALSYNPSTTVNLSP